MAAEAAKQQTPAANRPKQWSLNVALFALQVVLWLVALAGVAQLEYNCRKDSGYNPRDPQAVLGFGSIESQFFRDCSAQYSWPWWVVFFHLITMSTLLPAALAAKGSTIQVSFAKIATRFYIISVVQWCLLAYDANYHNRTYGNDGVGFYNQWMRGYSAVLAGAVGVLVLSFIFLICHEVPFANGGSSEQWGNGGNGGNDGGKGYAPGVVALPVSGPYTGDVVGHTGSPVDVERGSAYDPQSGKPSPARVRGSAVDAYGRPGPETGDLSERPIDSTAATSAGWGAPQHHAGQPLPESPGRSGRHGHLAEVPLGSSGTQLREENVAAALEFLNHPSIKGAYTTSAKRRFLQESGRGLTTAEVEEALRRSGP